MRAQAAARTGGLARMVTRNVHEDEREHVRSLAGTPGFKRSARERRKVEMLFAHLKRNLGLRRLRLRRPDRGRRRVPARRHRPNPATARPELGRAALDERPDPGRSAGDPASSKARSRSSNQAPGALRSEFFNRIREMHVERYP